MHRYLGTVGSRLFGVILPLNLFWAQPRFILRVFLIFGRFDGDPCTHYLAHKSEKGESVLRCGEAHCHHRRTQQPRQKCQLMARIPAQKFL
jgi:hypothetical protein